MSDTSRFGLFTKGENACCFEVQKLFVSFRDIFLIFPHPEYLDFVYSLNFLTWRVVSCEYASAQNNRSIVHREARTVDCIYPENKTGPDGTRLIGFHDVCFLSS